MRLMIVNMSFYFFFLLICIVFYCSYGVFFLITARMGVKFVKEQNHFLLYVAKTEGWKGIDYFTSFIIY